MFDAPTVSTQGALPGAVMPPYCVSPRSLRPKLPAAETTTMPASTARFAASVSGIGEEGLRDGRADREIDDPDVVGATGSRPPTAAPR